MCNKKMVVLEIFSVNLTRFVSMSMGPKLLFGAHALFKSRFSPSYCCCTPTISFLFSCACMCRDSLARMRVHRQGGRHLLTIMHTHFIPATCESTLWQKAPLFPPMNTVPESIFATALCLTRSCTYIYILRSIYT